ncbi:GNAT family N-acetyltransferase [Devosia sediminis]|uniref:GNAT family N-acetyltransferase n=1 Tax=Devosia sediminis TaxID=2798801 RepID=A0A934IY49_9HYPH|nr:GNAT family N-acetyltransferase [Devosia sediminis]MBJ3784392.1 GNAT family N-acetyltransferase [Devosia sediminis]
MTSNCRQAIAADLDRLLELIQDHARYEQGTATIQPHALLELLTSTHPPSHIIVVEEAHALLGYAALTRDYSLWSGQWFAHLDCLFVAAHYRGQGLGKALMSAAANHADRWGVQRLEWQTPAWNHGAIAFYEGLGATRMDKARFAWSVA